MANLGDPTQVVIRFNNTLNAQDVEGMMALMTADCVFENTHPPPDGERYEGQAAVSAFWVGFFQASAQPRFEIEDIFAARRVGCYALDIPLAGGW